MRVLAVAWLLMLAAPRAQVGDRVHITGCDKQGVLTRRLVKLWEGGPAGSLGRPVGEVFGTNQTRRWPDTCSGEVVVVLERQTSEIAPFVRYKVQAVIGGTAGWVAESYIGKHFPAEKCAAAFADQPAATLARCKK